MLLLLLCLFVLFCSLKDLQFFWKLNGRLPFGMRVGCAHCPLCGLSTQNLPNNHVVMMCTVTLSCLEKNLPFWLKILSNYSAMSLIQTMVESWIHADLPINNVDQACFLMVLSLKRALNHVCTRAIFGGHQVGCLVILSLTEWLRQLGLHFYIAFGLR